MKLKIESNLDGLSAKLSDLKTNVPIRGATWAEKSSEYMATLYLDYLESQGRSGGAPPPLSDATNHIYGINGSPDGDGVRNHVRQGVFNVRNKVIGFVGIPDGQPTIIAKVQNDGALIRVTEAMRGFLAAVYGIYLKEETKHIHIPARHSWDESLRKAKIKSKILSNHILHIDKDALS